MGDAFGERWFPLLRSLGSEQVVARIRDRHTPSDARWPWTDDTAMALAVLRLLHEDGTIAPDRLARALADSYAADPYRGYGPGMHELLPVLADDPTAWRTHAAHLFGGQGSLGNGAAMRTAPLGAWFHADLDQAVAQARLAAAVTHRHPEGVAGAVAVTLAAALAARLHATPPPPAADLLHQVADRTPASDTRDGLRRAAALPPDTTPGQAAAVLGNGSRVRADDTVPFALWSAAHHLDDLATALWTTAEGLGDIDTTCAITGGVVAARTGAAALPHSWHARREPLPAWTDTLPDS
ncbi:ADP-ribosylglycohydrolase family protein [Streptomyces sp. 4N509B]|uniref:ADP-ribosylglycohydrolase family protein n=1 Tax=Streptomyces sp. 4N509B TaxID=3457413 RepID=UPI003FD65BD7